jgi:RNA polymerase sigma-70 factor, ECF subfamily
MMSGFEQQVLDHVPALRRYAHALIRDYGQAEDLLQDSLERALSRRHLFIHDGNLRSWLFRIMHNIHSNSLRTLGRMRSTLELQEQHLPSIQPDQIAHVEAMETLAAVDRLSDECRKALWTVVVEGLGYREASQVLGVPPGTLMSRVSRAREELRML